jgi:hypothetical protein
MRNGRRRTRLTPQQRRDYHDDLARGVPPGVVAEWDRSLNKYIDAWVSAMLKHFGETTRYGNRPELDRDPRNADRIRPVRRTRG